MSFVFLSGGADPLHAGHVDYIQAALAYGKVIWLLNSDDWLKRKKGYAFMGFDERWKILKAIKGMESVYEVDDKDDTVCEGLRRYANLFRGQKLYFAKGGDRTANNTPEQDVCKELGIEVLFGIGGGKVQSSSDLVRQASRSVIEGAA